MTQCPRGTKYVPGGRIGYTAYKYPRGIETCGKQTLRTAKGTNLNTGGKVSLSYSSRKCTQNKPTKRNVRKSVAGFCVSPLVRLDSFLVFGSRVKLPWSFSSAAHFTEVNKGRAKNSPVLDVSYQDALKYCRHKFGNRAHLPSEKQWEQARAKGKITVRRVRTMEILSTVARTLAQGALMYLMAGLYPTTGRKVEERFAIAPQVMSATSVFRCVVPAGTRGRVGHF